MAWSEDADLLGQEKSLGRVAWPASMVDKEGHRGPGRVAEAKGGEDRVGPAQSRLLKEALLFLVHLTASREIQFPSWFLHDLGPVTFGLPTSFPPAF